MSTDINRAAVILITCNNQILGVSRGENLQDWGLPGGKVEEGETFVQGAARELSEETGLNALALTEVFSRTDYHDKTVITFRCQEYNGEIRDSHEGKVKWCSREELIRGSYGDYNLALFEHLNIT